MNRFRREGRLWLPEILVPRTIEAEIHLPMIGYSGWVHARAVRPDLGNLVMRETEFPNLITNVALDAMLTGAHGTVPLHISNQNGQLVGWAAVGTGTNAPSVGDTTLQNQGATRTTTGATGDGTMGTGSTTHPRWVWFRSAKKWAVGGATGTWTEGGFFTLSAGGTMFNRFLFRDQQGDPAPFTVLADEELWLDLFVRKYCPDNDVQEGPVTITGSGDHDYTVRAVNFSQNWAWHPISRPLDFGSTNTPLASLRDMSALSAINDIVAGAIDNSRSLQAYVVGSYKREFTSIWDPAVGNVVGGVGGFQAGAGGQDSRNHKYQMLVTPKIQKTSDYRLTMNFSVGVGRWEGPLS